MRIIGPAASVVAFALSSGCGNLYDMTVASGGGAYWFPHLSGELRLDQGVLAGTRVDIEDDLDLEDENTVNIHARAQIFNVTLEASYFEMDYSGQNVVTRDITFGGQTFTVGTTVTSDIDFLYASAKAKIGIVSVGPFAVGGILGVNWLDLEADLDSPLGSVDETIEGPFPVVGAVATVNQSLGDAFGIFADVEVSGLAVDDVFDFDGHFIDATATAGVRLLSFVKVGGGYRHMEVDVEQTDDDFLWDLSLGGPFVFAEIIF